MIEGLDHFFANNKTKEESFKYVFKAQETREFQQINPKLVSAITDWLKVRIK